MKISAFLFKKRKYTHARTLPFLLFVFVCFSMIPPSPPQWTYFLNDPQDKNRQKSFSWRCDHSWKVDPNGKNKTRNVRKTSMLHEVKDWQWFWKPNRRWNNKWIAEIRGNYQLWVSNSLQFNTWFGTFIFTPKYVFGRSNQQKFDKLKKNSTKLGKFKGLWNWRWATSKKN